MPKRYLSLFFLVLLWPLSLSARPRFPFPSTPDEVWQNDLDLESKIGTAISSFTTSINNISGTAGAGDNLGSHVATTTIKMLEGTVSLPALTSTVTASVNSGFYWTGADALAISNNGSQSWAVSAAGEITQPLQPSFLAINSATDSNVTGDGTVATVNFDTERNDTGAHFASDTFVASVTGKYLLNAVVTVKDVGTGNLCEMYLVTSNSTYTQQLNPSTAVIYFSIPVLADMDINDTALVQVMCSGGAKVVDVLGTAGTSSGTGNPTFFSGTLIN